MPHQRHLARALVANIRDEATAVAHVHDLVRRAGTSFYWAMQILPEPKRNAMFAIYAFCRAVDDIADEPAPVAPFECCSDRPGLLVPCFWVDE